jgi:hypothetical protein
MQPLDAALPTCLQRRVYKLASDTLPLVARMDGRIEQEAMHAAIPGDIDEADQLVAVERADIEQAVLQHGLEIAPNVIFPGGGEQPYSLPTPAAAR